jgi:hypothetical protein
VYTNQAGRPAKGRSVQASGRVVVLEDRRPVWLALSELFLDGDVAARREGIAATLAASPYSLPELQAILVDEVYPSCRGNMFSWPGGEWAGFDDAWLEERILRRLQSPFRWLHWLNLGRLTVHASRNWRYVARRTSELRSPQASGSGAAG